MYSNGFVTVGDGIEQVTDFAYYAANNARVQTRALLLAGGQGRGGNGGGVKFLSKEERKATNG